MGTKTAGNELLESVAEVQRALLKLTSILGIDAVSFHIKCDEADDMFAEDLHEFLESKTLEGDRTVFWITKKGKLLH